MNTTHFKKQLLLRLAVTSCLLAGLVGADHAFAANTISIVPEGNHGKFADNGRNKVDNSIGIGNGVSVFSPNGIAIGKGAYIEDMGSATSEGIAIGTGAKSLDGNSASRWFGDRRNLQGGVSGIAIGKKTYANESTVDIGAKSGGSEANGANRRAVTSIGADSYAAAHFSTIAGSYSSIVTDSNNSAGGFFSSAKVQGFATTITGALNKTIVNGPNGYDGLANVINGTANIVKNGNGSIIVGAGNKISNSVLDFDGIVSTVSTTTPNAEEANTALNTPGSDGNKPFLGSVGIFGGANVADKAFLTSISGVNNTLTGKAASFDEGAKYVSMNGYKNTATNVVHLFNTGSFNTVTNAEENIVLGNYNMLSGDSDDRSNVNRNIIVGFQNKGANKIGKNISNNQIIGSNIMVAEETTQGSLLGDNAKISASNIDNTTALVGAVALGANSEANRQAIDASSVDTSSDQIATNSAAMANKVYAMEATTDEDKQSIKDTVKGSLAAVSVGAADATRQIINVAAGSEDTDAVNVSQLRGTANALKEAINNVSGSWEVQANGDDTTKTAVDKTNNIVDFSSAADNNIIITKENNNLKFGLAEDITINSVTAGDTMINTDGVTITGGPSVTKTGIDAGNNKITNVADGTEASDAVNKGQLDTAITEVNTTINEAAKWNITANGTDSTVVNKDNNTVDFSSAADNNITITKEDNNLKFGLAEDITVNSVTAGDTMINTDGVTITGGPSVTKTGIDASNNKITNVADGTEASDAVNKGQLDTAITEVNDKIIKSSKWTLTANGEDATTVDPDNNTVDLSNEDNNIVITKTGNNVSFDLAKSLNVDAINSKTVNATTITGDTVNASTVSVGDTTITNEGLTITNGPSITKEGINANNTIITNVKAGVQDGDAVNFKQLTSVQNDLQSQINTINDDVADTGSLGAALAALKPIQYDMLEPTQIMAGVGHYKGSNAVALGIAHYSNESTMFHASVGYAKNASVMANAGITWKFGSSIGEKAVPERYKKGPISAVYALEDEVSYLKAENNQLRTKFDGLTKSYEEQKETNEKQARLLEQLQQQIAQLQASQR